MTNAQLITLLNQLSPGAEIEVMTAAGSVRARLPLSHVETDLTKNPTTIVLIGAA